VLLLIAMVIGTGFILSEQERAELRACLSTTRDR
jgi:hypothetical protein